MTDDESLAMLRDKYRAYINLNNEAAITASKAQLSLATYQLAFTEDLVRRKAAPGSTIDLNDGRVKLTADAKPWNPE